QIDDRSTAIQSTAVLDINEINLLPFVDEIYPWTNDYTKQFNVKHKPHNYQLEIIRHAVNSTNTIVCLRTGAGKTYIAALLIKYHYVKKMKQSKHFLALFFVPRKAIRQQQAIALKQATNLHVEICGDEQVVQNCVVHNDIIVLTPQKICK
ncbi:unnamed protein product, partial [Didymodactylos carnosus]